MEEIPQDILETEIIGNLSPKTRRSFQNVSKRYHKAVKSKTGKDKQQLIKNILNKTRQGQELNEKIFYSRQIDPNMRNIFLEKDDKTTEQFREIFYFSLPKNEKVMFDHLSRSFSFGEFEAGLLNKPNTVNKSENDQLIHFRLTKKWSEEYTSLIDSVSYYKELLNKFTFDYLTYIYDFVI